MGDVVPLRRVPEARDDTAARVLARVSQSKQVLLELRQQWYDAVAFTRGDQWSYWDQGVRRLRQRPALPWRIRVTDNQTLPLIQHQQALLTERLPTFQAMPRTDEEDDRLAAFAFEGLLRYHWDRLDLTDKLADAIRSSLITGNGFWRIDWNPRAGQPVLVPQPPGSELAGAPDAPHAKDGAPAAEPSAEPQVVGDRVMPPPPREVFTGDVNVTVVSPFAMHVDPVARSFMEARWAAQECYVNVQTIRDLFGAKAGDVSPDVGPDEYYNYELALRFDVGWVYGVSDEVKDTVRVIEYWETPNGAHKKGRTVTICNGKTLDSRDSPYAGRLPFVHFPGIKVDGRFWADGYVKHLRPLQTMHNRALSRFHEIMNLMGNPKWVVDKTAGIKETNINDRPGEVITKSPGSEVVAVAPPPVPTIHPQIMSFALNAMQTISGVNDPLAGNNPPNVRSGRSIAFLQEAGMRRFVPLALQTENALRQAGRMLLYLVQRFYTEDRTVRILGEDALPEVIYFKRADVERVADVSVVHGSMMPRSKAAVQEGTLELLQKMPLLFLDEDGKLDRDRIFRLMDMPAVETRWSPDRADTAQAMQEHLDAEAGKVLTVLPMEDHRLHMRHHRGYILSRRAKRQPEAMSAVMTHYAEHEMALMQGQGPVPMLPPPGMGGPAMDATTQAPGQAPGARPSSEGGAPPPNRGLEGGSR